MKSGRALAAVIGLICFGGGVWLGHEIWSRETKPTTISQTRDSSREWPPLTEAQIQEWVVALKPYPPVMTLVVFEPDVEAIEFFRSLKIVGKKSGWEFYHSDGSAGPGISGIQVKSTADRQPVLQAIVSLLNRMNYPATFTVDAGNEGAIWITIPEKIR